MVLLSDGSNNEWKRSERLTDELIKSIFDELDEKGKGYITIDDILQRLNRMGYHHPNPFAQASLVFAAMNHSSTNQVTFDDFLNYVRKREDKLYRYYKSLDTDNDGKFINTELAKVLLRESHTLTDNSIVNKVASNIMSRITASGDNTCSFREFTRAVLFMPELDVEIVFQYWSKNSHIDMGENYVVPDEPSIEKSKGNIFISGALAGFVSRTVTAPLDRIKVIMQAGKGDANIAHCFSYLYNEGGIRSFWRGNGINCIKIAPESAARFLLYDIFKRSICLFTGGSEFHPTLGEKFVAGAAAGSAAQVLIYPLEIIKTRLALSTTGEFSGIFDVAASIVRSAGFSGLYRGLLPSLLGIVPYAGIDLMVFNSLKEKWVKINKGSGLDTPDISTLLLFGAMSTTCGQVVAYPLQLIRTRLQAEKKAHSAGMLQCIKKVYKDFGILGFYRGLGPNLLKGIPAISISYAVFETSSKHIHGLIL